MDHGRAEGGKVDDTDAVGLALDEVDERSLALIDKDPVGDGGREMDIGGGEHVLHCDNAAVVVPVRTVSVCLFVTGRVAGPYQSAMVRMTSSW